MYYPAPLAGYDVKPGGKTALLVNDSSPYRGGMTFSWVGGDTQFFDNIGPAVIQYDTVRPSRTANREGMVTSFAEGALAALIVDGPPLFDYSEPWTIAFRVWLKSGLRNYVGQVQGGGVSAMQILADDDLGNYDPLHFASNSTADMPRLQAPSGAFPKDQWNTAVVTFNGGSQTTRSNYALYVNGTFYAFDLGSAVGTTVNETRLGRTDGAGRDMDGHLSGLRVWGGRDLPPSLAIELSKRFWSPFGVPIEYSSRIFYFVPEDTGGTIINISGIASILAGASGDPEVARALTGTAAILASASGTAEVDRELSGVSDILIDGQGALSTSGPTVINVSGSSYITMDAVGQLDVVREFAGQAEALVGASGQMDVDRQFAGLADILFSAQGTLTLLNLEAKGICIHRGGEHRLMMRSPENRAMKPPGEERC